MRYLSALHTSISAQKFTDFEWVVVDGASKDGTEKYLSEIVDLNLRYISEPDDGIYDAMNKAISLCKGDFIFFIGADDIFADDAVLSDVSSQMDNSAMAIFGSVEDGRGVQFSSHIGFKTYVINTIHHQSVFYNKKLFEKFKYDTQVPVIADYELNLLLHLKKEKNQKINRLIAKCGSGGVSNTSNEYKLYNNMNIIRSRHMSRLYSYLLMLCGYANITIRNIRK